MDELSFLLGSNPPPFPTQIKMASWTDCLIFLRYQHDLNLARLGNK